MEKKCNKANLDLDCVVCSSARYNLVAAVKFQVNIMAAIHPGKFDACSAANGWKVTETASSFYPVPEEERRKYKDAIKSMRPALCPQAKRETFFTEFEQRHLRPEEDPSVYKWELENILSKADRSLSNDAKTALLTRQFQKGLPPTLKLNMLEHNPTPTLDEMVEFTQRYRALGCSAGAETLPVQVDAVSRSLSD